MSVLPTGEIHCPGCDKDALLIREPVYEGFQKTGEILKCSSCGHVFDVEEDLPFVGTAKVQVFTDADRVVGNGVACTRKTWKPPTPAHNSSGSPIRPPK